MVSGAGSYCEISALSAASVEELMWRYQQADSAATTALVDRLSPALHRYFKSQVDPGADAADMLQETWLRIHRVRHTYRPGSPLLPWVYSIAHCVRIDNYRKWKRRSREVPVDVIPEMMHFQPGFPHMNFDELLAYLPESQRLTLTLLKIHGFTIEEVARATSSTSGAVKQRVHRAYERLRLWYRNS